MRYIPVVAAAALMLGSAPAAATDPSPTPPCATSTQYKPLGLAGAHEDVAQKPVPSAGHDIRGVPYDEAAVTRYFYRVDVSGSPSQPAATGADLTLRLSWGDGSDYDLYVYGADGSPLGESVNFNPQAGAGETIPLSVTQCTDLRVDVVNYLGLPTSTLDLDTAVSSLWSGL